MKLSDSLWDLSQAEELLNLAARAAEHEPAGSIEVQLAPCQLSWDDASQDPDPDVFHAEFGALELPTSLELASCTACADIGDLSEVVQSRTEVVTFVGESMQTLGEGNHRGRNGAAVLCGTKEYRTPAI